MSKLVPGARHLFLSELACKDGTPYPEKWIATRATNLGIVFDQIRAIWEKPITVLSGYRTESHNRKIGGARASQHVQGRAMDLRPPQGVSVKEFGRKIRALADQMWADPTMPDLIGGIGYYQTFIHVDIRPGTRLAVWHGAGVKDDTKE